MFGERARLLAGQHEGAQEARAVPDVVVLVVLGQVEHVLTQQLRLFRVRDVQLGGQVQDLQLHNVLLKREVRGHDGVILKIPSAERI